MIIYIHGFNSSGQSSKADELWRLFPDQKVIAPDLPWQPGLAMVLLEELLQSCVKQNVLLVGSSLGGYYAQYLGQRYEVPVVLINPALHPVPLLLDMVGEQVNYYTDEHYQLTAEAVRELEAYAVKAYASNVLLLLDQGDELLDYRYARDCYQGVGTVICFEGGSHRFEHLQQSKEAILNILP